MNGKTKAWTLIGLIVAFGSGWLFGQVQNVNKVPIDKIWADQWVGSVTLLARNGRSTELNKPEQLPLIVGSGLNAQSLLLGRIYDKLSPDLKKQLMFYIPVARAIAKAQQGSGPMQDRRDLLNFADCMQKEQPPTGSVSLCVENQKQ